MRIIISGTIICIGCLIACTPKMMDIVSEPSSQVSSSDEKNAPTKSNPLNPCPQFDDLDAYTRDRVETAFVLYRDEYKLGNYALALPYWRQVYSIVPGSNGRATYHLSDGIEMYKWLFDQANDTIMKRKYVDTVIMIAQKHKECFGDEAAVDGKLGFDLYYHFYDYVDADYVFNLFKSNIDTKGIQADYYVINPFSKLLFERVVREETSIEDGRKYAMTIFNAVNKGLAECKNESCETWAIINEYAPKLLEGLEGIDDFYDCAYYTDKYYTEFQNNPDSCDIINITMARMLRGGCSNDDPRLLEVYDAKKNKCYEAPVAKSCKSEGYELYNQGRYKEAIKKYEECITEETESDKKAAYMMVIAKIYYRDLKNFPLSRRYALDAASIKKNWGEPYMLIGNLYASSGPLCGPGRGWDSQIVTWPAIDMWQYAKTLDPTVSTEANRLINRYAQYMPNREDIHQRSLKAGAKYFVPCWIQEQTLIRTSD